MRHTFSVLVVGALLLLSGSSALAQSKAQPNPPLTINASGSQASACKPEAVLAALIAAEALFIPRTVEEPALIEDPYPGTSITDPRYFLNVTPAVMKIDWDTATPEELIELAKSRAELKARIAQENAHIKAEAERRKLAAQLIRDLLTSCGVQFVQVTCGGCGDITTPGSLSISNGSETAGSWKVDPFTFPEQSTPKLRRGKRKPL